MVKHTQTNFLSVFDNFMRLALRRLRQTNIEEIKKRRCQFVASIVIFDHIHHNSPKGVFGTLSNILMELSVVHFS